MFALGFVLMMLVVFGWFMIVGLVSRVCGVWLLLFFVVFVYLVCLV